MTDDQPRGDGPGAGEQPTVRMTGTAHDRGATHQAARDQYVTHHNYYGAPGPAGEPGGPPGRPGGTGRGAGEGWFRAHRKEWIGFAGVVAAAVITAVATYAATAGDDKGADPSPPPTPAGTSAPTPTGSSAPSSSASAAAGSPSAGASRGTPGGAAAPAVQWHGTLVLNGGGKDLDAPRPADVSGDNDVVTSGVSDDYELGTVNGATVALWEGDRALPSHADCAGIVDAAGTSSQPLKTGTVLCVQTRDGRIARSG